MGDLKLHSYNASIYIFFVNKDSHLTRSGKITVAHIGAVDKSSLELSLGLFRNEDEYTM